MSDSVHPLKRLKDIEEQARKDHNAYAAQEYDALYVELTKILPEVLCLDHVAVRHTAQFVAMRLLTQGYARVVTCLGGFSLLYAFGSG